MEPRADRMKKTRKDKRKTLLIYAHLYSLSLLMSGLLLNIKENPKGNVSTIEAIYIAILFFPCVISYYVASHFFEEKIGYWKMIIPILLGILAGSLIWLVF